jgi:DNA-binding NtrC family response regulator
MAVPSAHSAAGREPVHRLKILHLEDSPADALLVEEMLRADHVDCEIVVVAEPAEFERELAKGDVDVVISDYSLPRYCGTDALKRTRSGTGTPFIFVSGSIGEERAVEAVRMGATDYVMKEHLRRLGLAVRRAVEGRRERAPAPGGREPAGGGARLPRGRVFQRAGRSRRAGCGPEDRADQSHPG